MFSQARPVTGTALIADISPDLVFLKVKNPATTFSFIKFSNHASNISLLP